MPARNLPGLGLRAGWGSGEDGWGSDMNTNLIHLSVLAQLTADDVVDTLPVVAADGEIYLLTAAASANPGMIAARDDGLWRFFQPVAGWEAFVRNPNARYRYMGGGWVPIATAASIPPFTLGQANYNLQVNPLGTGVIWSPQYQPQHELPTVGVDDVGKVLKIVLSPGAEPVPIPAWMIEPPALPEVPPSSAGKVVVIAPSGSGFEYEEDGKYRNVAPGYVATEADFSGRVILGASGNVIIPAGITRGSTLTIVRASTAEVIVDGGAGVTLNVADGRKNLRSRFSAVSVVKIGTNQYTMFGDVAV